MLGNSKRALLAVLNPVPSTSNAGSGSSTPSLTVDGGRRRNRSIPLELLEEEELILNALEVALGSNPPGMMKVGEKEEVVEVMVRREGGLVARGLRSVKWECRGLRGGKERVKEIWQSREKFIQQAE